MPSDIFPQNMTSSATSFRQQTPFWKKKNFFENELLVIESPNLVGLIYMSSDNFRHKIASSTTSVREPSPSLCCELRRAVYSPPRRWALVSIMIIFTARRSEAGGNKNEPLVLGSPNLVQRFVPTPSQILPEMVSLATSGREQSAILYIFTI